MTIRLVAFNFLKRGLKDKNFQFFYAQSLCYYVFQCTLIKIRPSILCLTTEKSDILTLSLFRHFMYC